MNEPLRAAGFSLRGAPRDLKVAARGVKPCALPRRINSRVCFAFLTSVTLLGTGCDLFECLGLKPPAEDDTAPETVPDFHEARFTHPTQIDNPFFPLVPGTTRTYAAETEDGTERIVVEVLDDTRDVMGVTCRVVRDRVFLDDVLIEDTHDWYAQDDAGNVWYMGEQVDNHNYDDEGMLLNITHEGEWEAGKDVAGLGT